MSGPLRVVHYVNQFFGGIGGEDQARVGVTVKAGPMGPGRALETALGDGARVEATIVCGDNFASEQVEQVSRAIAGALDRLKARRARRGPGVRLGAVRPGLRARVPGRAEPGRRGDHRHALMEMSLDRDAILAGLREARRVAR